jgi:hypothetical protein
MPTLTERSTTMSTLPAPAAIRVIPGGDTHPAIPSIPDSMLEEIIDAEVVDETPPEPEPKKTGAGRKLAEEREARRAEAERKKAEAEEAAIAARLRAEEAAAAAARRAEQEANRAVRIQPDTKGVLKLSFVLSGLVLATAFTISYFTLAAAAEWMRLPTFGGVDVLRFVVPGFAEVAIILSSVFYAIDRSRGGNGKRFKAVQWTLTLICSFANAAHTIAEWGDAWGIANWESIVGTILAAAAPLVVVWVSTSLSSIVFAEPEQAA